MAGIERYFTLVARWRGGALSRWGRLLSRRRSEAGVSEKWLVGPPGRCGMLEVAVSTVA
jgi:hypothetical protein